MQYNCITTDHQTLDRLNVLDVRRNNPFFIYKYSRFIKIELMITHILFRYAVTEDSNNLSLEMFWRYELVWRPSIAGASLMQYVLIEDMSKYLNTVYVLFALVLKIKRVCVSVRACTCVKERYSSLSLSFSVSLQSPPPTPHPFGEHTLSPWHADESQQVTGSRNSRRSWKAQTGELNRGFSVSSFVTSDIYCETSPDSLAKHLNKICWL